MKTRSAQPQVSLLVIAYNQENFIREAIKSALAQSYEPLEIILSDDSSHDQTFAIMKEEVERYCGRHRIVLTKTPRNLGLTGNINHCWAHATGDFIVVQAGDDLSFPNRVDTLVKAWQQTPKVDLVVSDVVVIDACGREIQRGWKDPVATPRTLAEAVTDGRAYALGCAVGYTRKISIDSGAIDPSVIQEDWVMGFRALSANGLRVVNQPLVKYRIHDSNVWFGQKLSKPGTRVQARRFALNRLRIFQEWIKAWDLSGRGDGVERRRLEELSIQSQLEVDAYSGDRIEAIRVSFRALRLGFPLRNVVGLLKRHLLRVS